MRIYNSNHKSISHQNDRDITVKTATFLQITGVISRTLKFSQVQKHTRMNIYNALALPTVQYGCETWTIREQDKSRMSAEIKFVRRTAQCTWQDYKTNEGILSELKINPVVKKIQNYGNK